MAMTKYVDTTAHLLVEFFPTPSLIFFSCCNKNSMAVVQTEIVNRKGRIAKMNIRVKELLGLTNSYNTDNYSEFWSRSPRTCLLTIRAAPHICRANVAEADRICKEAKRIIDTDLNWHNRIISVDFWDEEYDASMDEYFGRERELLDSYGDLRMLPMLFYFPPDQSEPLQQLNNEEHVKEAQAVVGM